jgi:hypothetical protein
MSYFQPSRIGYKNDFRLRICRQTANNWTQLAVISGFLRDVDDVCALLGYYAASCGNCLLTFRDNVSVPSSRVKGPRRKDTFGRFQSQAKGATRHDLLITKLCFLPSTLGLSHWTLCVQITRPNVIVPVGFELIIRVIRLSKRPTHVSFPEKSWKMKAAHSFETSLYVRLLATERANRNPPQQRGANLAYRVLALVGT